MLLELKKTRAELDELKRGMSSSKASEALIADHPQPIERLMTRTTAGVGVLWEKRVSFLVFCLEFSEALIRAIYQLDGMCLDG